MSSSRSAAALGAAAAAAAAAAAPTIVEAVVEKEWELEEQVAAAPAALRRRLPWRPCQGPKSAPDENSAESQLSDITVPLRWLCRAIGPRSALHTHPLSAHVAQSTGQP